MTESILITLIEHCGINKGKSKEIAKVIWNYIEKERLHKEIQKTKEKHDS